MRVAYERLIGLLAKYDKNRKIGINAFDPEYVKTIRIFLTSKTPQKEGALSIDAIEKLGNSLSLNSDFSPDPNSAAGQMYYELRELFNQNLDVIKLLKAESLLTEDNFALLDVNNMPNIFRSMKELNRLTQQNLNILKGAVKEKKSQLSLLDFANNLESALLAIKETKKQFQLTDEIFKTIVLSKDPLNFTKILIMLDKYQLTKQYVDRFTEFSKTFTSFSFDRLRRFLSALNLHGLFNQNNLDQLIKHHELLFSEKMETAYEDNPHNFLDKIDQEFFNRIIEMCERANRDVSLAYNSIKTYLDNFSFFIDWLESAGLKKNKDNLTLIKRHLDLLGKNKDWFSNHPQVKQEVFIQKINEILELSNSDKKDLQKTVPESGGDIKGILPNLNIHSSRTDKTQKSKGKEEDYGMSPNEEDHRSKFNK